MQFFDTTVISQEWPTGVLTFSAETTLYLTVSGDVNIHEAPVWARIPMDLLHGMDLHNC